MRESADAALTSRRPHPRERWQQFFSEDYLRFSAFILTPQRTAAEVDAIEQLLGRRKGLHILDLGCGAGRISIPLAAAGHRVVSLDGAPVMLDQTRVAANHAGVTLELVLADMRELTWQDTFDAVINVGTAFGYVVEQHDDQRILRNVARALRPGGSLILDTENRERTLQGLGLRPWFDLGGTIIWSERRFDAVESRWQETLRWLDGGQVHTALHEMRLYTATELARMIREAGMDVTGLYGGLDRTPYTTESVRMVFTATRPGGIA